LLNQLAVYQLAGEGAQSTMNLANSCQLPIEKLKTFIFINQLIQPVSSCQLPTEKLKTD